MSKHPKFYGLAAAIKPDKKIMQITRLEGYQHEISIKESQDLPFSTEDIIILRDTYDTFLSIAREMVNLHKETRTQFPIFHGWPKEFEREELLKLCENIRNCYPDLSLLPINNQTIGEQTSIMRNLTLRSMNNAGVKTEHLFVRIENFGPTDNCKPKKQLKHKTINPDFEKIDNYIFLKSVDAKRGSEAAKKELIKFYRDLGVNYAKRSSAQVGVIRFVPMDSIYPEEHKSWLLNIPVYLDYLREAFVQGYIETLKIPNNMCIKFPSDKRNPGFADVVSTAIQDAMDLFYFKEIIPGSVMIQKSFETQ